MFNDPDSYHGDGNAGDEAREDFDFEAGEQLNEEDKAILQDAKRPIIIFNRVGTTVDSVAGLKLAARESASGTKQTNQADLIMSVFGIDRKSNFEGVRTDLDPKLPFLKPVLAADS